MKKSPDEIIVVASHVSWLLSIIVNSMSPALFSYLQRKDELCGKSTRPTEQLALLVHEYLIAMFKEADRIERRRS